MVLTRLHILTTVIYIPIGIGLVIFLIKEFHITVKTIYLLVKHTYREHIQSFYDNFGAFVLKYLN